MNVLMLGWEFPPAISGGLGRACEGLSRAMAEAGHQVTFMMPHPVDRPDETLPAGVTLDVAATANVPAEVGLAGADASLRLIPIPSNLVDPYAGGLIAGKPSEAVKPSTATDGIRPGLSGVSHGVEESEGALPEDVGPLITESYYFAERCVARAVDFEFDVIHAHDWMTWPAANALAGATGRPVVAHVHSTEYDRAGEDMQRAIYDVERRGLHAADAVIAVSRLTAGVVTGRYGVDPEKVSVVYNGTDHACCCESEAERSVGSELEQIPDDAPVVLFLGRLTRQKGPRYFLDAAAEVLDKNPEVRFVVAGSGDEQEELTTAAEAAGIGDQVIFTGFLSGPAVDAAFARADVFVMPSVAEPFGLAAVEAVRHDVPVIVSRRAGVSEVLRHVMKVDFWDTHQIAQKILAVLRHPQLSEAVARRASVEVQEMTWAEAAVGCAEIYEAVIESISTARESV